jgi:hypothetical protein
VYRLLLLQLRAVVAARAQHKLEPEKEEESEP